MSKKTPSRPKSPKQTVPTSDQTATDPIPETSTTALSEPKTPATAPPTAAASTNSTTGEYRELSFQELLRYIGIPASTTITVTNPDCITSESSAAANRIMTAYQVLFEAMDLRTRNFIERYGDPLAAQAPSPGPQDAPRSSSAIVPQE